MVAIASKKTGRKAKAARSPRAVVQRPVVAGRLEPEGRIVLPRIDWKTYLSIDKALGDDNRPGMRLSYHRGALEIMSASSDHERIKSFIADCIKHYCREHDIWLTSQGQMTRRITAKCAAEADESFSFDRDSLEVGLVVEVCITSGGISKLELHEALGHPEVWLWRKGKIEPHAWIDGEYRRVPKSTVIPGIDIKLIEELSVLRDDFQAFREFSRRLAAKRSRR